MLSGAHVTKLALEGGEASLCASGVEYMDSTGAPAKAQLAPGGEVLLCCGAVQSPQILMLSGVGPRSHLEEMGIEVRKELGGVGEGLQDHPVRQTPMCMCMCMCMYLSGWTGLTSP